MAERRMIHKKISLSEQFNDMDEFAQLVFVLMIPHADDWGSLKGTARVIRGMAIPLNTTRTDKEVESALEQMEKQELIWRYEPDTEGPMLQFRRWEDHQTGLGNRTKPKRKLYYYCEDARRLLEAAGIDWDYEEFHKSSDNLSEVPKDSPVTEQNRTKQKGTKDKGTRKRDPLLDHKAFKRYREIMCHSVDKAKRRKLVKCAEEFGIEPFVAILEMWRDREYNPDNIKGICEAVERKAKSGTHRGRGPTGADDKDYLREALREDG